MKDEFLVQKHQLQDSMGRPLTQSLFLEIGYSDYAVYTLKEYDYLYKDKMYPSLKRLFLSCEDPLEYEFAEKHLLGWQHWKRMCENQLIAKHVEEWREELELKIRARAVRDMVNLCASENGNFSAAKFLADRGWEKRAVGRPSKAELEKRAAIADHVEKEFGADIARLEDFRKKAN